MAWQAPFVQVFSWILGGGPPLCNTGPIPPGNDENGEETATFQTLDKDGNGDLTWLKFLVRLRFFLLVAVGDEHVSTLLQFEPFHLRPWGLNQLGKPVKKIEGEHIKKHLELQGFWWWVCLIK